MNRNNRKYILIFVFLIAILNTILYGWDTIYVPGLNEDWNADDNPMPKYTGFDQSAEWFRGSIYCNAPYTGQWNDFKLTSGVWGDNLEWDKTESPATDFIMNYISNAECRPTTPTSANANIWMNFTDTGFYTFNTKDPSGTGGDWVNFAVMFSSDTPETIISVDFPSNVDSGIANVVGCTMSGTVSKEENVFFVYTTNNWGSRTAIYAETGTVYCTATIPALDLGNSCTFYIITTTCTPTTHEGFNDFQRGLMSFYHDNNSGNNYYYQVTDMDTIVPVVYDTVANNPNSDSHLNVVLTMQDSSGISHTGNTNRSIAYFSWTENPSSSNNFYSTSAVSVGNNEYSFKCPEYVTGNVFTENKGRTLYWSVEFADNDSGSYSSTDDDSSVGYAQGSSIIIPDVRDLVINEIGFFGDNGSSNGDYVELYNNSSETVYLEGLVLSTTKQDIVFNPGDSIIAGEFYLIEDTEGVTPVSGDSIVSTDILDLSDGDTLVIEVSGSDYSIDSSNITTLLGYEETGAANQVAIERKNQSSDGTDTANWQPGCVVFNCYARDSWKFAAGTPRTANSSYTSNVNVYISEIMYSSESNQDSEYIELYNNGPDSYIMYNWSVNFGNERVITNFDSNSLIIANDYFLIEDTEFATGITGDMIDSFETSVKNGAGLNILCLYGGLDLTSDTIDQAGETLGWYIPTNNTSVEKPTPNSDGTNSANWLNSSGNVGGVTGTPGSASEANSKPTVLANSITILAEYRITTDTEVSYVQSETFVPFVVTTINVTYQDLDDPDSIKYFWIRYSNGNDTLLGYWSKNDNDTDVNILYGDTIVRYLRYDTSISGNNVLCTYTIFFHWELSENNNYKLAFRGVDDDPDTGDWYETTPYIGFEKDFVFNGSLIVVGQTNDTLANGISWVKGGEQINWSNLTVLYKGTNIAVPDTYFTIILKDSSGDTESSRYNPLQLSNACTTGYVNYDTNIIYIRGDTTTANTNFQDTRQFVFRVDDTGPIIYFDDRYYVMKSYFRNLRIFFADTQNIVNSLIDTVGFRINGDTDLYVLFENQQISDTDAVQAFTTTQYEDYLDTAENSVCFYAYDYAENVSYGTITVKKEPVYIDGSLNDWQSDEKMERLTNEYLWFQLAWDDENLYFAYYNKNLDSDDGGDGDFFFAVSSKGLGYGTNVDGKEWGGTAHDVPDSYLWQRYIVIDGNTSTGKFIRMYKWSGGNWLTEVSGDSESYQGWSGNGVTEVRIDWDALTDDNGKPDTFAVIAYQQWEDSSNIWTVYPTFNNTGYAPVTIEKAYIYLETTDTVSPNSQAEFPPGSIIIDGEYTDWPSTTALAPYGVDTIAFAWDDTYIYYAFDRSSLDQNNPNVYFLFIDTNPGVNEGSDVSPSWGGGTHNLPIKADYYFAYRPIGGGGGGGQWYGLRRYQGGWPETEEEYSGYTAQHISNGFIEVSIPRVEIGSPTSLAIVPYAINQTGAYLWSFAPDISRAGNPSQTLYGYYQYDLTNDTYPGSDYHMRSSASMSTIMGYGGNQINSFSPLIDGFKDPGWGDVPWYQSVQAETSPGPSQGVAEGLAADVYVTNDAGYLYLGWEAYGDPFNSPVDEDAQYAFAIFKDTCPAGVAYHPWVSTVRFEKYKPDIWVAGAIGWTQEDYFQMSYWTQNGVGLSDEVALTNGTDYKVDTLSGTDSAFEQYNSNKWGECRIPLSVLNVEEGDTIYLMFMARHSATKEGINDCTPYDTTAVSEWADFDAYIDGSIPVGYVISYDTVDMSHIPNSEPVTGKGKMRSPLYPGSSDNIYITMRLTSPDIIDGASIIYTLDDWSSSSTQTLEYNYTTGNDKYYEGIISSLSEGNTLRYIIKTVGNNMTTYIFGSDTEDFLTPSYTTAKSTTFWCTICNSVPSMPDSAYVAPIIGSTFQDLTCGCSGSIDVDSNDTVTYQFNWYKIGTSAVQYISYDSEYPFTSVLSKSNLTAGDEWYCKVRATDAEETTNYYSSNYSSIIQYTVWNGTAPTEVNQSTVSESEWIWKDSESDVYYSQSSYYDNWNIDEVRYKTDTQYFYFLYKLVGLDYKNYINISILFDTCGYNTEYDTVNDDAQSWTGDKYEGYKFYWGKQVLIHDTGAGIGLEIGSGRNYYNPNETASVVVYENAKIIEGRLLKSLIGLTSDTVRIMSAMFSAAPGHRGSANDYDITDDFSGSDMLDAIAIVQICTGGNITFNDSTGVYNTQYEEMNDTALDFWVQLSFYNDQISGNSSPGIPTGPSITDGDTVDTNQPTIGWNAVLDSDNNDSVTSYMVEIDDTESFIGTVNYRVNVSSNTWTLPTALTEGITYYWRVRARDRSGALSTSSTWKFYLEKYSANMTLTRTRDQYNNDAYGNLTGIQSNDTSLTFDWSPAIHSLGDTIQWYHIEVSSYTDFSVLACSDVIEGTSYIYTTQPTDTIVRGYTYYARIQAIDINGNASDYSDSSDGIYVCRRSIDGNWSDWYTSGSGSNTTALVGSPYYEGIWYDALDDNRTDLDGTNGLNATGDELDIKSVHITADRYNMYVLMEFKASVDGVHYAQIAWDLGSFSTVRAFIGTGNSDEDGYVNSNAAWEYLTKIQSGNDWVYTCNTDYDNYKIGAYSEDHTTNNFLEIAVKLDDIEGDEYVLGQTIDFTPVVLWNDNGSVGACGTDNCNLVDVATETTPTWTEVEDQSVDYYLSATFNSQGHVTAFDTSNPRYTEPEVFSTGNKQKYRDYIMYYMCVDRFYNGDQSNDLDPATNSSGGDFEGIRKKLYENYFNEFSINCLYTMPITDYTWGVWGFNDGDYYGLARQYAGEWTRYRGFDALVDLIKDLHHMDIDFLDDIVIPQKNARLPWIHPEYFHGGQSFGGNSSFPEMADVQQYWIDVTRFWYGCGLDGWRVDNPKFYGTYESGSDNWQYQRPQAFFQALRSGWNEFTNNFYTFGEVPESGGAGIVGDFCRDGIRLHGDQNFRIHNSGPGWAKGTTSSEDFKNTLVEAENTYIGAVEPIMFALYAAHDYNRIRNDCDFDIWKVRNIFAFITGYVDVPNIYYGDEHSATGWKSNDVGTEYQEQVQALPWDWYDADLYDYILRLYQARARFRELRGWYSDRTWRYSASNYPEKMLFGWSKSYYDREVVFINNTDGSAQTAALLGASHANTAYKDWMSDWTVWTWADYNFHDLSVPSRTCRLLIKGEYGLSKLSVHVRDANTHENIENAIVSINHKYDDLIANNKSTYTRGTNSSGWMWTDRIVTDVGGGKALTFTVWKKGYMKYTYDEYIVYDGTEHVIDPIDLTPDDGVAPSAPTGLMAYPRRYGCNLDWSDNPEDDIESYWVFRSETPNDDNPDTVIECLRSLSYDCDYDNGLTAGTRYYYKLKAMDINDNMSEFSEEISVVPGEVTTVFLFDEKSWSDDNGNMWGPVDNVYIEGTADGMGINLERDRYASAGNNRSQLMTDEGNGWWSYSVDLDPGMKIHYRFLIESNGNYIDEGVYTSYWYQKGFAWHRPDGSEFWGISADNPNWRGYQVEGKYGETVYIVRKWEQTGDVAPRAPEYLTAIGKNNYTKLGWRINYEPDMSHYTIYRSTDNKTSWHELNTVDKDQKEYFDTDDSTTIGETIWYRMTATDIYNHTSGNSDEVYAVPSYTDNTAPDSPQNLSIKTTGYNTLYLNWNYNTEPDVIGYYVYRDQTSGFSVNESNRLGTLIDASLSPYYEDNTLSSGRTYYYKVTAIDDSQNESDPSDEFAVFLCNVTFKVDMGNISPNNVSVAGTARVMNYWEGVTLTNSTSVTWQTTLTLDAGQTYQYKYAYNDKGTWEDDFSGDGYTNGSRNINVPYLSTYTVNNDWQEIPGTPADFEGYGGNQKAYLRWDANTADEDLEGYNVYYSTNIQWYGPVNSSLITNNYYEIEDLTNGLTYYYVVRAVDQGDIYYESSNSVSAMVTPSVGVPVIFKVDRYLYEFKDKLYALKQRTKKLKD